MTEALPGLDVRTVSGRRAALGLHEEDSESDNCANEPENENPPDSFLTSAFSFETPKDGFQTT